VAIWLTLLIDVLGTSMIALKVKSEPHSEDPYPWVLAGVAYAFSVLSLAGKPIGILYVRPLYGLVCNLALATCIYYFRRKKRRGAVEVSLAQT